MLGIIRRSLLQALFFGTGLHFFPRTFAWVAASIIVLLLLLVFRSAYTRMRMAEVECGGWQDRAWKAEGVARKADDVLMEERVSHQRTRERLWRAEERLAEWTAGERRMKELLDVVLPE